VSHRVRVIFAFGLVYVFWGSTYLGIRLAVDRIPPILLAGVRFSIAGWIMLLFCSLAGRRVTLTRSQFWKLAAIGLILLSFSNAVLAWAELYVPTGLAALLVSIVPIWFLLIERFLLTGGDRIRAGAVGGIGLGVLGILVLFWPRIATTRPLGWWEAAAAGSLLVSSFTWAFGSVLARRWNLPVDPLVASGWEMAVAGTVNTAVGAALGQHLRTTWDLTLAGAVLYLVVFGSWVGFSAYIWLLRHVPTAKVATYAYVNPIVAVFLGWLILGEPVDGYLAAGAAIIVPAVALVTRAEAPPKDGTPVGESG